MAILGEIFLLLISFGILGGGVASNALSLGFSGKVSYYGLFMVVAGIAAVCATIYYGPIVISVTGG